MRELLHIAERLKMLQATDRMVGIMRTDMRPDYLIRDLKRLADEVGKRYRLFTSSFSYLKIRNDVETARLDFVGKIQKSSVVIRGQLLGIPVSTIVIGSQQRKVTGCDVTFWPDLGVQAPANYRR
ncbi:hypothetical protein [Sphingomonas desiccabilis]|nr:hypothetical protein [Sphingomonas desiccabilis]